MGFLDRLRACWHQPTPSQMAAALKLLAPACEWEVTAVRGGALFEIAVPIRGDVLTIRCSSPNALDLPPVMVLEGLASKIGMALLSGRYIED